MFLRPACDVQVVFLAYTIVRELLVLASRHSAPKIKRGLIYIGFTLSFYSLLERAWQAEATRGVKRRL